MAGFCMRARQRLGWERLGWYVRLLTTSRPTNGHYECQSRLQTVDRCTPAAAADNDNDDDDHNDVL